MIQHEVLELIFLFVEKCKEAVARKFSIKKMFLRQTCNFFKKEAVIETIKEAVLIDAFIWFRSSRPEVFCKKSVLRNFAKFTGKHLRPAALLKKDPGTVVFL